MERRSYLALAGTALLGGLAGCGESRSDPGGATGSGTSLALAATPFDDGGTIPPAARAVRNWPTRSRGTSSTASR